MIISIICGVITLIAIVILIIKVKSDKLNFYNNKIIKVEEQLETAFENKLSLLSELQSSISSHDNDVEFNLLCDIEEIKDDDFMLNSILNKAFKEINSFFNDHRAYIPSEEENKLLYQLQQVNTECKALKDYYNQNAIILNKLTDNFPNNTIATFKKIQKKELYNDPIEVEFEILKKK